MDFVNMSKPPSETKDFFPSPALSLSLAGIFRDGARNTEVEDGEEGGGGSSCRRRKEVETVDIISSTEESWPLITSRTISEDHDLDDDDNDDPAHDPSNNNKKRKRKKYHRHTPDQIKEMEALFKDTPHPDENQRQQLSQQLGLNATQVKFWFQNRRTQIKATQERDDNRLLKREMEKFCKENKSLRETIQQASCLNCGYTNSTKHASFPIEEQQLRIENTRLKLEVKKLHTAIGKYMPGTSPGGSSYWAETDMGTRSSLDLYSGIFGIEKSRITEIVNQALQELNQMASSGETLWIRSFETGREILNYDEYIKLFPAETSDNKMMSKRSIEASRETGILFIDLPRLIQIFADVNQWKEIFSCIVSKAATVDVIMPGEGENKDGLIQLMFAELQMLTPVVPTREVYFVRYSKQLSIDKWAIVDVSIDQVEDSIDASLTKCRKRPSGCIIEDKNDGHCQVTWIEHMECQKSMVNSLYRTAVNSGLAFGAKRWMTTLMMQCDRLVFSMATHVPNKDSSGVDTMAGKKSIFTLAQRMTVGFCCALGASSYNSWNKVTNKSGYEIRVASRKNLNDPGEPIGLILCAVSSTWLQVSQHVLFEFLKDASHRNVWDIKSDGGPVQSIVNLAKGQDRGNAVTIQTMQSKDNNLWVLQDNCTNAYESMIVYAPVDINGMQSVMKGCDSSNIAVLPSGFSILPDGVESRSLVITSKPEEKNTEEGGSLLTIAFQILTSDSPTAKLTGESIESVNTFISSTLQKIKSALDCEDA